MAFWKDKQGNELTFKEFMDRWKKGVEGITPLQQTKATISGTYITLAGIVLGIIASIIAFKVMWWVVVILIGAFIITFMQLVGLWQKMRLFKMMEGGQNE